MSGPPDRSAYREDLDGLRAIAVVSVIFFHLGIPSVSGGFVGVDIFFVLSGFLITSQIVGDIQRHKFSLVNFYERRIRRIVPALIVLFAATTLFATLFLLPEELVAYLQSLLAAAFSCSNILFFLQNDYFGPANQTQLLLHTWSLGVEEQFYILYPILLSALLGRGHRITAVCVWAIALASLAACILQTPAHERAAFFLLPMRAWQLLCGAVIALRFVPQPEVRWIRESAGLIGIAAIAFAVAFVNSKMKYPGAYALAPTLGAGLVIWSGAKQDTFTARILKTPPLPFIGLISYSLYLWHWPIIVGAHFAAPPEFKVSSVALIAATFVLAFLSWRYIEQPFRQQRGSRISRAQIFTWNGVTLAVIAATVSLGIFADGWPSRFSGSTQRLASAVNDFSPHRKSCHFETTDSTPLDKSCILGNASDPAIIVYGDSHGIELSYALSKFSVGHHQSVREFTTSGCPSVLNFEARKTPKCRDRNAAVTQLLASLPPTTVLLAVGWDYGAHGDRKKYLQGLTDVLDRLRSAGHRLFLIGTTPEYLGGVPIPEVLARLNLFGHDPATFHFSKDYGKLEAEDRELFQFAAEHNATYLPLYPLMCDSFGCRAEIDDKPIYFDTSHLSVAGAEFYVRSVVGPALWP
jgi:peptidoglycan/LPS O-acetylase OafA/YrhL